MAKENLESELKKLKELRKIKEDQIEKFKKELEETKRDLKDSKETSFKHIVRTTYLMGIFLPIHATMIMVRIPENKQKEIFMSYSLKIQPNELKSKIYRLKELIELLESDIHGVKNEEKHEEGISDKIMKLEEKLENYEKIKECQNLWHDKSLFLNRLNEDIMIKITQYNVDQQNTKPNEIARVFIGI